jgi:hypothetical protein
MRSARRLSCFTVNRSKLAADNAARALGLPLRPEAVAELGPTIPIGVASTFAPDRRSTLMVNPGSNKQVFLESPSHSHNDDRHARLEMGEAPTTALDSSYLHFGVTAMARRCNLDR